MINMNERMLALMETIKELKIKLNTGMSGSLATTPEAQQLAKERAERFAAELSKAQAELAKL